MSLLNIFIMKHITVEYICQTIDMITDILSYLGLMSMSHR